MTTTVLRFIGGVGSGKTTALRAFFEERTAAGVKCLLVSGDSTLAGIRRALRADNYTAVLIDGDDEDRAEMIIAGLQRGDVLGLDHIVVACRRHPAEAQCDAMLADLQEAATTLRRYETLHRAKNTDESTAKAEVNAALASRFEATIAKAGGQ